MATNTTKTEAANTPAHNFKQFDWLAQVDPGFDEARRHLAKIAWTPSKPALAIKHREIIAAVILGHRAYPSMEAHLRRALAEGATLREILEGFQTAAILSGMPILHFVMPYLSALHAEFGDKVLGAAPAAVQSNETQKTATGPVSKGMREWAFLDEFDPAFDGARRDLTAFVWTPTAPALPVKIRELVACAVLAYRAFPTLDGHFRRALREGASMGELVEAMEVASLPGGFPVIHFALPYLDKLNDEVKAGTFR